MSKKIYLCTNNFYTLFGDSIEIRRRQAGVRASQTPQRQIRGGKSDQANRPAVDVDKRLQTESGEIRNTDFIHHCAGQG